MGSRHHPGLVVLPNLPRLDRLVTVVPIAQAWDASGITVLALSLEQYTAGFVLTFQAQSHGAVPFVDTAPRLTLAVTDDRDGQYLALPCGASGEGGRNDWQWRLTYRCTPALDPCAATLELAIAVIMWERPDPTRHIFVPALVVEGPWVFTLRLPPAVLE